MAFDTRQALSIQAARTIDVGRGSGGAVSGDWQIPSTNFIAAKRPLKIIAPVPTTIGADSFYLWAEPGVRYEAPIGVTFGAFPYHFSVSGPEGMTIGNFLLLDANDNLIQSDDYGVVKFDVPATGLNSFSYTVTITDQELNTQAVTVNVTVDQTKFIHVADTQAGTGDGTPGNPLGSFQDMWKDSTSDATYAGKIIRFRGGNYTLYGDPVNNGTNVMFDGNIKPKTWIAYPGETPVFDCQQAKILMNDGNMDDCAFIGLNMDSARADLANSHFFWCTTGFKRPTFWKNNFSNIGRGTSGGTDNPACVFIPANIGGVENLLFKSNTADTIDAPLYNTYNISESLFENNKASNSTSNQTHFIKGQMVFSTVRCERSINSISGGSNLTWMMGKDGGTAFGDGRSHDNEFCYNIGINSDLTNNAAFISWATTADDHYNQWSYRNTFKGRVRSLHGGWEFQKNLYTEDFPDNAGSTFLENQNIPASDVDIDGLITGVSESLAGQYGSTINFSEAT